MIEDPDQPGNHVLELKNTAKGTAGRHMANDASAPGIADGTFSARVKVLSKSDTYFREGFVYRVEDADAGKETSWWNPADGLSAMREAMPPGIPNTRRLRKREESGPMCGMTLRYSSQGRR